jgi:hypothetical protein
MFISYATNYFGHKFHIIDYVFIFTEQFPSLKDYFMFNGFINDFDITGQVIVFICVVFFFNYGELYLLAHNTM